MPEAFMKSAAYGGLRAGICRGSYSQGTTAIQSIELGKHPVSHVYVLKFNVRLAHRNLNAVELARLDPEAVV